MIHFPCLSCGMKFKVKDEFAGRALKCPGCRKSVQVPAASASRTTPVGVIDGAESSLDRVGVNPGVTLATRGSKDIDALAAQHVGRYVLDKEIARGGMGAVLRGIDRDIRREVAIKFMLDDQDAKKKARFVEEAQITGQLEHPNIVPIHELGVDAKKRLFFTMKMVKGRSLAEILKASEPRPSGSGTFTLNRLLNVLVNICHALEYAHSRNVIHRDLKPANIMVGDFGEVYVMDWGLAKVLGKPSEPEASATSGSSVANASGSVVTGRDSELTQEGAIVGTPTYMPPEQARGEVQAVDQRSDIYSLGGILYAMLTTEAPVEKTGDYLAVMMRVAEGDIKKPEQRFPQLAIPSELSAIAMKALAKEPADRYQSVATFRRDVELFVEGRSVTAKQDTFREQFVKLVKRNKGASAAVGVLLPVLLSVLLYSAVSNALERARTAKAYQDYQDQVKKSVPAFLEAARLAAERQRFDKALEQVDAALTADPEHAEGRLLKGQILIVKQDFPGAVRELTDYSHSKPDDAAARRLLALCQNAKPDDLDTNMKLAAVFYEEDVFPLVDGLLLKYGANSNEARQVILKMYRARIEKAWPGKGKNLSMDTDGLNLTLSNLYGKFPELSDLSPLKGMPLSRLTISNSSVADLSPLAGMPLISLSADECRVTDLSPLKGMRLRGLALRSSGITDLSPLSSMPLSSLQISRTRVSDLSPLEGMPLRKLIINDTPVTDLSPLAGMPLITLGMARTGVTDLTPLASAALAELTFTAWEITRGMDVIRDLKSLTKISHDGGRGGAILSSADFWMRYDAGAFRK